MTTDLSAEPGSARNLVLRVAAAMVVLLAFSSLVAGAALTDARLLGGPSGAVATSSWLLPLHRDVSVAAVLLALILAVLAIRAGQRTVAMLAGLACAAGLVDGLTATSLKPVAIHAIAGVAVFACLAAAAALSWASEEALPQVEIRSAFPVRRTAVWIPWIVLSQVTMGSLYRHDIWSVMPHMAGAIVTAFLLIADAVLILQAEPQNTLVIRCARWALGVVLVQVLLGITDFLLRLLDFQESLAWRLTSSAHVLVGGITFAVSIVFAVVVGAHVRYGAPISAETLRRKVPGTPDKSSR